MHLGRKHLCHSGPFSEWKFRLGNCKTRMGLDESFSAEDSANPYNSIEYNFFDRIKYSAIVNINLVRITQISI